MEVVEWGTVLSFDVLRVEGSDDGLKRESTSEEERLDGTDGLLDTHRATMLASLLLGMWLSWPGDSALF